MTGLETTKPTQLCTERLDLTALKDKRCNRSKQLWAREDGTKSEAAHNPTVQRWEQVDGRMQRASKSQGEYTPLLSKIHDILTGRVASPFPEEVVTGLRVRVAEVLGKPYTRQDGGPQEPTHP